MEKGTKWTKGPWRVVQMEGEAPYVAGPDACDFVADMLGKDGKYDAERMRVNAQLIAAAPELVEALLLLLDIADYKHKDCTDQSCSCRGAIRRGEVALRKAGAL